MSLFKSAVKARLPLIGIHTDDPRGIGVVVDSVLGLDVKIVRPAKNTIAPASVLTDKQVGIVDWLEDQKWPEIGRWCEEHGCSLLIVNPEKPHPWIVDVGAVEVPLALVRDFIGNYTQADPAAFVSALAGLSLANIDRIARIATAQFGEFTPQSLRAVRREFFQMSRGLEELESQQIFYEPSAELTEWLALEGRLLKADTHPMLTPRGFLFSGAPGTGKTSSSKYLAHELQLPLYRLDIGAILSKWSGESDRFLREALRQADSFAPCVLLLDEVEKLFEVSDSSGVLPRLLSSLLWWLQEHKSRVLVVMTTNNPAKIPPELYRPGRIDQHVAFIGLLQTQLLPFMVHLAQTLSHVASVPQSALVALQATLTQEHAASPQNTWSQARITEEVLRLIKREVLKSMGDANEPTKRKK